MLRAIALSCLLAMSTCTGTAPAFAERGIASFYGYENGPATASGERFRPNGLTAAHRTRRLGSVVTVTNLRNGRKVTVRINDRGPAKWTGRIIDLSLGAARVVGMTQAGVVEVTIQ